MARNSKFEWETAFIQSGLTGNTGFVGLLMATLDNGDGRNFFVTAASIERWTGLNERTVRSQIDKLIDTGWLVRTKKGGRRGNAAWASEYRLSIPDGQARTKLSSQAERSASQPENKVAQPEADARVLDHSSLDHPSLDHSFLDPTSLAPGDELTGQQKNRLRPDQQDLFVPSFREGDYWVYEPELMARGSGASAEAIPPRDSLSAREERQQRNHYERVNREEGLDANGEPLEQSARRKNSRSRYSSLD